MSEFIPRTVSATQGSNNSVATRWHPSGSGPREGGRRVAVGGGRGSRGITHFLRVHFLDLVDHTGDAAPEVVSKLVPATHTLRSGSPGLAADSERRCEIEHGHSAFAGGGPKRGVDAQSLAIWRVNRVPVEARDRHRRRLRHPGPVCAVRSTAEPVFRYGIAARIAVSDGVRRTTGMAHTSSRHFYERSVSRSHDLQGAIRALEPLGNKTTNTTSRSAEMHRVPAGLELIFLRAD